MYIESLPVYQHIDEILKSISDNDMLVLSSAAGSGKTTVVPYFLLTEDFFDRKILLLQNRRIAAQAAADRISVLLGEKTGLTVGLRTRDETLVSPKSRLEVITEGVLLRMLQKDPALEDVSLVIFDEFHERTVNADLGLAFLKDSIENLRPDLKILFMSASFDRASLESSLPGARFLDIPGTTFPVETEYLPVRDERNRVDGWLGGIKKALAATEGDVLTFLPGIGDMRRLQSRIADAFPGIHCDLLHGSFSAAEQRSVILKKDYRRIVLATNVAETSVTIEGITAVVDTGLEKRARYNPATGMDHIETVRITRQSAVQRKGRAGRLGPGTCIRCWDKTEHLTDRQPEIITSDLTPVVLQVMEWGALPENLEWITAPNPAMVERAVSLCESLHLVEAGRISALGKKAAALPLHPRLGAMVLGADDEYSTALLLAALISDNDMVRGDIADLIVSIKNEALSRKLHRTVRQLARETGWNFDMASVCSQASGRLLYKAFPDRVAIRQDGDRWLLPSGRAARFFPAMGPDCADYLIAFSVEGTLQESLIRGYALLSNDDFKKIAGAEEKGLELVWKGWNWSCNTVTLLAGVAVSRVKGGKVGDEHLKDEVFKKIQREGFDSLPWKSGSDDSALALYNRICFFTAHSRCAGLADFSGGTLVAEAPMWLGPFIVATSKEAVSTDILKQALLARLGYEHTMEFEKSVPQECSLPSGRRIKIDYSGERPVIAGRVQEFFGTESLSPICGVPPLIHLLSPASRPVQITDDLAGFWKSSYKEVKKDLAGRYPKHFWPDDPLSEAATTRAKPKKK